MNSNFKNSATVSSGNCAVELGAKKEGVVRVGMASVKAGNVGERISAQELTAAVQNTLSEYLKNPKIELVQIVAKLPSAIDAEAKSKECDFVLYSTVTHKKGGGVLGGMFGKTLGSVVAHTGGGSWDNTAGDMIGGITAKSIVAATVSSNAKAKDEINLDINLKTASDAAALTKQFKAKAKSNGEDIITPLIERFAQAIFDATDK